MALGISFILRTFEGNEGTAETASIASHNRITCNTHLAHCKSFASRLKFMPVMPARYNYVEQESRREASTFLRVSYAVWHATG